jgi:hypothetical protein
MYDTLLLTPAGACSLAAIGAAMGEPKITVPDVLDEKGTILPGIERMDLVLEQHRDVFEQYALQDARIAALWLIEAARVGRALGLAKKPTIAAMAVEALIARYAKADLALTLGYEVATSASPAGASKLHCPPIPEAAAIETLCADALHGGRSLNVFNQTPWNDSSTPGESKSCGMSSLQLVQLRGADPTSAPL